MKSTVSADNVYQQRRANCPIRRIALPWSGVPVSKSQFPLFLRFECGRA
jgi:hypothetical protein